MAWFGSNIPARRHSRHGYKMSMMNIQSKIHDRERWPDKIEKQYFILIRKRDKFRDLPLWIREEILIYSMYTRTGRRKEPGSLPLGYLERIALNHSGHPPVLYSDVSKTALPFSKRRAY